MKALSGGAGRGRGRGCGRGRGLGKRRGFAEKDGLWQAEAGRTGAWSGGEGVAYRRRRRGFAETDGLVGRGGAHGAWPVTYGRGLVNEGAWSDGAEAAGRADAARASAGAGGRRPQSGRAAWRQWHRLERLARAAWAAALSLSPWGTRCPRTWTTPGASTSQVRLVGKPRATPPPRLRGPCWGSNWGWGPPEGLGRERVEILGLLYLIAPPPCLDTPIQPLLGMLFPSARELHLPTSRQPSGGLSASPPLTLIVGRVPASHPFGFRSVLTFPN